MAFQVAESLHMANTLLLDPRVRDVWGPHGVKGLRARGWSMCRSVSTDQSQPKSIVEFSRDPGLW